MSNTIIKTKLYTIRKKTKTNLHRELKPTRELGHALSKGTAKKEKTKKINETASSLFYGSSDSFIVVGEQELP